MKRIVGKSAPAFNMATALGDGSDFGRAKLEDYKDQWLVLFFYPLDFTFVCPTEITAYSKAYDQFMALNTEVLAVSVDSEHSHKAWINGDLGKVAFPIASDMTKSVSKDYGVLLEDEGIALRGLFIINPEGDIKYSVVHDLNVGRSVGETLRVLKALQSGGLCAIDWSEGDDHL